MKTKDLLALPVPYCIVNSAKLKWIIKASLLVFLLMAEFNLLLAKKKRKKKTTTTTKC